MFRIGEFSRIARVSCRLLRHYDELGLLRPATVDRATGYRTYAAAQLPRLRRILVLKELGLSLEEIGRIVEDELTPHALREMLLARRAEVERQIDAENARLRRIEQRITELDDEGRIAEHDVTFRSSPALAFLAVRQTVGSFDEARRHIAELVGTVPRHLPRSHLGQFMVIVHSPEFEPDAIDAELGFILHPGGGDDALRIPLSEGRTARCRKIEAVERMAVCVRAGPPEEAHATTGAIGRRIAAEGYVLAGPNRELFLQVPNPGRLGEVVVEMQFPVVPC